MRSKLALAALVAASFVGVTTMASAQTQPAPGASSEGNVGPGATDNGKMTKSKKVSSNKKSGTTTGMSKSKSSGQSGTDSGADGNGGMSK
jgi:hypothetical protein